jgi:MFS family permease
MLSTVLEVEVDLENGDDAELEHMPSAIIPRGKRRGLFAYLVIGMPEIEDPVQYSRRKKNFIVFIIALAAVAAPMGLVPPYFRVNNRSAIYLPALPHVIEGLHTNANLVNLTVALYMLALGLFPLWWSAASERVGRRTIYVISFALWVIFNVLCATSQHIIELIITRILAAGAGASVQAVGAGTLADIYIPQERGKAMGWFYIGPLMGPLIVLLVQSSG